MFAVVSALLLVFVAHATGQSYERHAPYVPPVVVTVTETITITATETIRIPVTSDVWVSTVVNHPVPVTHLVTEYSYVPIDAYTKTSVVIVTSTPISVVTQTSQVNSIRTAVSVFTTFVTETETKELYHTISHHVYNHEFRTVPVHSVQTLVQRVITTVNSFTTVTVTHTTYGYQ
ncbi:uncharacterized protein LOC135100317 [Scylla paramamosain]|uniref:uncharacterized protein LOC135100317 n=1 Tax=Scylla paramamosain TaxID=85552 RepID=UPI003082D930